MIVTAMRQSWFRRITAGGAFVAAVVLVGVTASPGAASPSQSAALAQAKRALLVKSNFPSDWTHQGAVTTSGSSSGSFPGANQLASCLGVSKSLIVVNTPSATSPTYQNPDGTQFVQDNVSVFRSAKQGSTQYALISGPKVPGCLTQVLQGPAASALAGSAGKGVTLGKAVVTAVSPAALVPHTSGFTIAFPVTVKGVTLPSTVTVLTMVRGTLGSQVTVTAVGGPVANSFMRQLAGAAYGRT
jgi:hypothetical protein